MVPTASPAHRRNPGAALADVEHAHDDAAAARLELRARIDVVARIFPQIGAQRLAHDFRNLVAQRLARCAACPWRHRRPRTRSRSSGPPCPRSPPSARPRRKRRHWSRCTLAEKPSMAARCSCMAAAIDSVTEESWSIASAMSAERSDDLPGARLDLGNLGADLLGRLARSRWRATSPRTRRRRSRVRPRRPAPPRWSR